MSSMAAGNKSTETYNKAVELADKLYQLGEPDGLDKGEHDRLWKRWQSCWLRDLCSHYTMHAFARIL